MKLRLSTWLDVSPETVWSEVQTARLLKHVAWPLVRFIPVGDGPFETIESGGRHLVKLRLFGILPFGTQWIVTSMHEPETGQWPKRLRDNGHSALIKKWDHWITVMPDARGGTRYQDEVDISAGMATPFVWVFAQAFYRHRQRRWRGLVETLGARRLIWREMAVFSDVSAAGDADAAWQALERAHIVSQSFLGPHLANHRTMLSYAVTLHDWREVAGQIFRLALAPLGVITRRIPLGNTGRSNVSAFEPMPIPDDLRQAMAKQRSMTDA